MVKKSENLKKSQFFCLLKKKIAKKKNAILLVFQY